MNLVITSLLFAVTAAHAALPALAETTIPTAPVGDIGNLPDQLWPFNNPTSLQFGSVGYLYRIGTTEVTNAQYAAFLNAKAASDPLELYNPNMGSDPRGGIARSGATGNFTYSTRPNMAEKPVNFVSWYDSIRFANWLNNGQGTGDTETGAYTILGGTATPSNGPSITRNPDATWFLTSEDEWYKAAYYQPSAAGGDADSYWLFPTKSNSQSTWATANAVGDINNAGANVINYDYFADWNDVDGNVTTVGSAGPLSASFYGTSDQGGNVWEWNEALVSERERGLRGGAFHSGPGSLSPPSRLGYYSAEEASTIGFRVATVPEPSTLALTGIGAVVLLAQNVRRCSRRANPPNA